MTIIKHNIQTDCEHKPKDKDELLNEISNKLKLILLNNKSETINNTKKLNNKVNLLSKSNQLKNDLKIKINNIDNDINILKSKIEESLNINL